MVFVVQVDLATVLMLVIVLFARRHVEGVLWLLACPPLQLHKFMLWVYLSPLSGLSVSRRAGDRADALFGWHNAAHVYLIKDCLLWVRCVQSLYNIHLAAVE